MKCPECQSENPKDAKFCGRCGMRLLKTCTRCGKRNPPANLFCNECGHDLGKPRETGALDYSQPESYTPRSLADKILTTRNSIEGERKLVTVLFADLANFTTLTEKLDPEEVHQLMDGCFKILMDEIHRYEGMVNQFTGDGIMALFGAPLAREDHAQRACHAALSIQSALGAYGKRVEADRGVDFQMRVGLNSGQVIVGTIGDDLKMDYTAIGNTTNLASRMESMAKPGSVMVSGNTYKFARDYFEFVSLGPVAVKGMEEPEEAYELVRPTEVETRIKAAAAKGLTRFVGRRKQMDTLREAFEKVRSGSGQIVGILGDAGVGKSRLLMEFRRTLPVGEHTFLEGSCLHYGRSIVYLPVLDLVKSLLDIQEGDQAKEVQAKLRDGLSQLDQKLLGDLAPLQDVLSLTVEDKLYVQIDAQQKRQRIFEAIRNLLVRASEEKPLVLLVEDLHWVDKTSQDFLDFLAEAVSETPILLVLLYRPEYIQSYGGRPYVQEIALDQLSQRTSIELVQAILEEGEVVPELSELILGRAGGNPLFVEELTQSLLENGSIHRENDHYVLTQSPHEIEVPDTVQGIIAARMDRVDESLKRIMQVASVIGREFAYRILAAITGMKEDLKASLTNLQGLEFIYEKQLFPELEYIFKHALTQEVAYNSLLLKRRRDLHEKIGQAIEQIYAVRLEECYELLAYHYVHSDNTAKAIEYLDLANQKAVRASAIEDAKTYFDKAMELLDTSPDTEVNQDRRLSILVNQRQVFLGLFKIGDFHDLLIRCEYLAMKTQDQGLRASFYNELGTCDWIAGRFDQSIRATTKSARLSEASGNREVAAIAHFGTAFSHLFRGDFERVLKVREESLPMMDSWQGVRVTYVAAWACAELGRWEEAVELGQEALRTSQAYSDRLLESWAAIALILGCANKRDLDSAAAYGEFAVDIAPTPAQKAYASITLAWVHCLRGELRKGIDVLLSYESLFKAAGFITPLFPDLQYLAEGYLIAGESDKTRETAEELLELSEQCGARGFQGKAYRVLGELALSTNPEEATSAFDQAISIFRDIKAENHLALAYSGMGRLHKQQGKTEQAREYLTKSLQIFERLGTLIEPDKVRQELEGLPAGR